MKIIKKATVVCMAFMLILAMSITSFATEQGSITVKGTTAEKTYDIYKIFDLTHSENGTNVSYTIDEDWTDFFAGSDGKQYIVNSNNSNSLDQIIIDGNVKYINITEDNVAEFAQDALKYAAKKTADSTKTAEGTTVVFDKLALGYYLVYPEGATDIASGYASICSLTSTTPDGEVDVKATYPTITKEVNDKQVDIGQTVTYTITGEVPDTTGYDAYKYEVSDTLSSGLTFNESVADFKVEIDGSAVSVSPTYKDNGFVLNIDMTKYQAKAGKKVTITYSAVVNSNAVIGQDGNANKAFLKYSNNPKDSSKTTTTPPIVVNVYTAAIEINKVDGADKTIKLEGAKFILMDDQGKYYKFTKASGTSTEKAEWIDSKEAASVVETNDIGKAYFKGLESGAYKLVEIEAPAGYNMLTQPVNVNISHTDQTATVYQIATVENNSGTVLPGTGGIGTKIFYIIGIILILAAGISLFARRRFS